MESKEKQIFNENKIEINGTIYELIDGKSSTCASCDVESYCNKYNLFKLCGGPNSPKQNFKKQILTIEGLPYVAKINNDASIQSCSMCDVPVSSCTRHNLITKCSSIHPHVYLEQINIKQRAKEHKKRIFNPENCQRSIKDQFIVGDVTFTLSCHHSFEWTIAKTENGKITIEVYPNRNAAKKEYERKKKLSK